MLFVLHQQVEVLVVDQDQVMEEKMEVQVEVHHLFVNQMIKKEQVILLL